MKEFKRKQCVSQTAILGNDDFTNKYLSHLLKGYVLEKACQNHEHQIKSIHILTSILNSI